jgi:hypothetical protein
MIMPEKERAAAYGELQTPVDHLVVSHPRSDGVRNDSGSYPGGVG